MTWFNLFLVFASLSVRTSHVQPNPYDYEISFGMEKQGQMYLNRQWERERGQYFIDEEYWVARQIGSIWMKDRYLNLQSNDVQYNRSEIRYKSGGWGLGYAVVTDTWDHNLVMGYEYDSRFNLSGVSGQATVRTDLFTNFQTGFMDHPDYSFYGKVKFNLGTNLGVAFELRSERIQRTPIFQGKIKLELELPGIKP